MADMIRRYRRLNLITNPSPPEVPPRGDTQTPPLPCVVVPKVQCCTGWKANIDDTRYVPQVAAVAFLLRGKTRPRQTNAAFLIKKSRKAFETGEEEQHWKGNKFHTIIYVFHPSLGTLRGLALLCLCAWEIERKASR